MHRAIVTFLLPFVFSTASLATPFSVRCERDGYYFVTFDDQTGHMVSESPSRIDGEGRAYKGRIRHINENEIRFVMLVQGLPPGEMIFHRKQGVIEALIADGPSPVLVNCVPTTLRAVLSKYELISPFE
jgi:hypothetical protein